MIIKNLQFNNDTVYVYLAKFDNNVQVKPVLPAIRNQAIQRCTDLLTRQQRYCVWRLLDYALKQHCGKGVDGFNFTALPNGNWSTSANARFSLSHCDNVVVVAISAQEVGVDVEAVASFTDRASDEAFINRVLNNAESQQLRITAPARRNQTLALFWTSKESVFKMKNGSYFSPRSIDTTLLDSASSACDSRLLEIDGKQYALSVATASKAKVEMQVVDGKWIFG